jgi:putative N-acetylmannosamine-6-phosphate epimerase
MNVSVLEGLQGGLIVSCQAYAGEPMLDPRTMAQVAERRAWTTCGRSASGCRCR